MKDVTKVMCRLLFPPMQYSCSDDQVTISIGDEDFVCSCSEAGEEV